MAVKDTSVRHPSRPGSALWTLNFVFPSLATQQPVKQGWRSAAIGLPDNQQSADTTPLPSNGAGAEVAQLSEFPTAPSLVLDH